MHIDLRSQIPDGYDSVHVRASHGGDQLFVAPDAVLPCALVTYKFMKKHDASTVQPTLEVEPHPEPELQSEVEPEAEEAEPEAEEAEPEAEDPDPEVVRKEERLLVLAQLGVQLWSTAQVLEWIVLDLPPSGVATAISALASMDTRGDELLSLRVMLAQEHLQKKQHQIELQQIEEQLANLQQELDGWADQGLGANVDRHTDHTRLLLLEQLSRQIVESKRALGHRPARPVLSNEHFANTDHNSPVERMRDVREQLAAYGLSAACARIGEVIQQAVRDQHKMMIEESLNQKR
eukprot:COSAG02_NODE_2116_length_9799_cov_3.886495_6_plen_291_part_01